MRYLSWSYSGEKLPSMIICVILAIYSTFSVYLIDIEIAQWGKENMREKYGRAKSGPK